MTKQEIINIINKEIPNIKTEIFKEEASNTDKNNIGSNQFRELANICRHSDCYDEIEMLIRYNEAKVKARKSSWAMPMKNGVTLAEMIIGCMKKIQSSAENEQQCMNDLSMFFGYFYWNARIWAAETNSVPRNHNSDNFKKNNNGEQRRKK